MAQTFYDVMISHGRWMLIPAGLGATMLIAICAILIGSVLGCLFAIFKISEKKEGLTSGETLMLRSEG